MGERYWAWHEIRNWWHAAPEGTWTFIEPRWRYGDWIPGLVLLLFGWMLINTPYSLQATAYIAMMVFGTAVYIGERVAPEKIYGGFIDIRMTPTWLYDALLFTTHCSEPSSV